MPEPIDPRDRVRRTVQEAVGDNAARWDESFEEERVKFVLNRCGLADKKWHLLALARERFGRPRLTFSLFNECFPTFPLFMGATRMMGKMKLHEDPKASLPELFNHFDRSPIYTAYMAFQEQKADKANNRALALVFPRNRVKGALVIHDGGLDSFWVHGTVMTYTGGTREKPFKLVVQPFAPLVEAIYNGGHGWRSGE